MPPTPARPVTTSGDTRSCGRRTSWGHSRRSISPFPIESIPLCCIRRCVGLADVFLFFRRNRAASAPASDSETFLLHRGKEHLLLTGRCVNTCRPRKGAASIQRERARSDVQPSFLVLVWASRRALRKYSSVCVFYLCVLLDALAAEGSARPKMHRSPVLSARVGRLSWGASVTLRIDEKRVWHMLSIPYFPFPIGPITL